MSEQTIRAKYGGKLAKAINRAIRAEIPGGNEALEKLTQLAGAARQSHWKDGAGRPTEEAEAYFRHQREVIDPMHAQVHKRWGISPVAEKPGKTSRPQRKGKANGKSPSKRAARAPRLSG